MTWKHEYFVCKSSSFCLFILNRYYLIDTKLFYNENDPIKGKKENFKEKQKMRQRQFNWCGWNSVYNSSNKIEIPQHQF